MEIQPHPERLKQMLPWGKLIQENFASYLSVNVLSLGGYFIAADRVLTKAAGQRR